MNLAVQSAWIQWTMIVQDIQSLLDSDDIALKHKIVYIAGYLVCKYGKWLHEAEGKEVISAEHLNRTEPAFFRLLYYQ